MKYRKYLNIILPIIIIVQWLNMFFFGAGAALNAKGFKSLRYFTILSNLLEALACFIWLYNKNERIKYVATVSLMLTFLTVIFFLGPLFGYPLMFEGPNLYFHLIIPLAALLEILFLYKGNYSLKDNLYGIILMALYGIYYLLNNLINGTGKWPDTNDWYGFMSWGIPMGFVIFFLMLFITYMIGFMIRFIKNKVA